MLETSSEPEDLPAYRQILLAEFKKRCQHNKKYSLRAFAKALDTTAATLSRTLSGNRPLSMKQALRMVSKLSLKPADHRRFLASAGTHPDLLQSIKQEPVRQTNLEDYYERITNWYDDAILELTRVKDFQSNPRWIAKQLGLGLVETRRAIARLIKFNLLRCVENGGLIMADQTSEVRKTSARPSPGVCRVYRQLQEKALYSLENDPVDQRSMQSMTIALDPKKISKARKMIREFAFALAEELQSPVKGRLYHVSIDLFPLQK